MKKSAQARKVCAQCGSFCDELRCALCKTAHYCNKECQKAHWKAAHKLECDGRKQKQKKAGLDAKQQAPFTDESSECSICIGDEITLSNCLGLPCGHTFHRGCLNKWRSLGREKSCPVCRSALPPGASQLVDQALALIIRCEAVESFNADHFSTLDDIIELCEQAISAEPDDATTYMLLGNARWSKGDLDNAWVAHDKAMRMDGTTSTPINQHVIRSSILLEQRLVQEPRNAKVIGLLAKVKDYHMKTKHKKKKVCPEAQQAAALEIARLYKRALKLNKEDIGLLTDYAQFLHTEGE
jgi:hypothetical protein